MNTAPSRSTSHTRTTWRVAVPTDVRKQLLQLRALLTATMTDTKERTTS